MEHTQHDLSHLFAQLGRPNGAAEIASFIAAHRPLPGGTELHDAAFWSSSQALFLCEAIGDDADWAQVAERLNGELHAEK
ncbi:MAG: DUF2789 family protein [Azovibrio sp.]|uniref:DUF2789 family protein n=1 Tax=Azovibrio sp. TaxID=1872673 RepID=UPI003C720DB9